MSLRETSVTADAALAELKAALAQAERELADANEREAATGSILKVISGSPGDLQPVFEAVAENAVRLCGADRAFVFRFDGEVLRAVVAYNAPPDLERFIRENPIPPNRASGAGRAALERRTVQIPDVTVDPEYTFKSKDVAPIRTVLTVPILKGADLLGVILTYRLEVRLFNERQISLVESFAMQAAIAIENARLLSELRESLERQTATSHVLEAISASPGDLAPVFKAMLVNATRICEAKFGVMFKYADGEFRALSWVGNPPAYTIEQPHVVSEHPHNPLARIVQTKEPVHISDLTRERTYIERDARIVALVESAGAQSLLVVPMLRDAKLIGAIAMYWQEARSFTDKQMELIRNFAAQAVIAIENTRLLNELRQRTDDLTQSLEQQTATADVLSVMSRSKFDLAPVLQSVVDTAARLCRADQAVIFRLEDGLYRFAAGVSLAPEYLEIERAHPIAPGPGTAVGRAALNRAVVRIEDAMSDPLYAMKEQAAIAHLRSIIGVPLLRDGEPIGVIALARCRIDPFGDREIELVTTFADQAVIAIENVRLFDEVQARTEDLQESLAQQTATADVLKVISRSTFDLQTVLQTLVESAARLCDSDKANITRERNGAFYRAEAFGFSQEFQDYVKDIPIEIERGSAFGRALVEGRVIHIPDVLADPDYTQSEMQKLGDYRTVLAIPMMREKSTIGVLTMTRSEVRPFTDKQIELATTFADQAAIAIENVRLFDEIHEKSRQLEEASKHKSQFLANMSHELRTPLNAILGYTELIADGVYGETPQKVHATLQRIMTNGRHLLGLINDVLDLSKIEAGQLTLSLTDYSMKDVVYAVYGAVEPLAAEKKLNFKAEIMPDMAAGHGDERRLTQVLLNLVGNAIKFTDAGDVVIKASQSDGIFSVAVCDTGPGISDDDQKKLFREFQQADSSTTKKKGGTGLGLAISKKIIEMHGGRIWLESEVGKGSTFAFTMPTRAEQEKRQA